MVSRRLKPPFTFPPRTKVTGIPGSRLLPLSDAYLPGKIHRFWQEFHALGLRKQVHPAPLSYLGFIQNDNGSFQGVVKDGGTNDGNHNA